MSTTMSDDVDEPDFFNMPMEQVNQYLREHGYNPDQVAIRGKILVEALVENVQLREDISKFAAFLRHIMVLGLLRGSANLTRDALNLLDQVDAITWHEGEANGRG
jgi:hypothetical protein